MFLNVLSLAATLWLPEVKEVMTSPFERGVSIETFSSGTSFEIIQMKRTNPILNYLEMEVEKELQRREEERQRQIDKSQRLAQEQYERDLVTADFYHQTADYEYRDESLWIRIKEIWEEQQHYFVAEAHQTDLGRMKTVFSNDQYEGGFQKTSQIASEHNAILAINASAFTSELGIPVGPVIREGVAYNEVLGSLAPMTISWDGQMSNVEENLYTSDLMAMGVRHSFRFGPGLLENYEELTIDEKYNARAGANPRTAIGQRYNGNWYIIVAEGRFSDAKGLSLSQLQDLFMESGTRTAYNLDGGGSSALYFQGQILNRVSDGEERHVADIIYFN